jgi:hypothetical protein
MRVGVARYASRVPATASKHNTLENMGLRIADELRTGLWLPRRRDANSPRLSDWQAILTVPIRFVSADSSQGGMPEMQQ